MVATSGSRRGSTCSRPAVHTTTNAVAGARDGGPRGWSRHLLGGDKQQRDRPGVEKAQCHAGPARRECCGSGMSADPTDFSAVRRNLRDELL